MRTACLTVAFLAAAVLAGCHDSHEYDLSRGPRIGLAAVTANSVTVRIADAFPKAEELRMERRVEGHANFKRLSPDPGPADAEYIDATVEEGVTYFYRLRAIFAGGKTARSVILRVTAEDIDSSPAIPLTVAAPAGPPPGALLSPDGATLAWIEADRALLLDVASDETRFATPGDLGPETALAFAPDGALVLAAGPPGEESLHLVHRDGAAELLATPPGGASGLDVSSSGLVAIAGRDGVSVLDPSTGEAVAVAPPPASEPRFLADGETLTWRDASGRAVSARVR